MQRETIAVDFGNYELKVCDGGGNVTAIRSIQYKLPTGAKGLKTYKNSPLVKFENGDRYLSMHMWALFVGAGLLNTGTDIY